jgi:small subunit ribosomal protein S2
VESQKQILYVAWRRFKIVMSEQPEVIDIKKKVISTGIRVGTQVKTKFMKQFIEKASPEGLYMLNIDMTLEKIKTCAKFINRVGAENIIACSGRQYAGIPIEKFCEMTGAKQLLGRFMPGTLTNPSLPYYVEPKLILISDPEVDVQALIEATNAGIPIIGIANTDNVTSKLDVIIPANNRGRKSLATIYWLLVRQILIEKGELKENESMKYEIDDFEAKMIEEEIE